METHMNPLADVQNDCDNTAAMGWTNHMSNSLSNIAGTVLYVRAAVLRTNQVTASIFYHPRRQNLLAENAYFY